MFNMANDGALKVCVLLFIFLYFVKHVNCSLTSTEARTLNSKFELMKLGVENKLISAFVKIEDVRDSMRTCKCHEPSNTSAEVDQIAGQSDQSKSNESNEIERRNNKTLQTCIDRVAKSFHDEKRARKVFEKEMVDLVRDLTKSPVHGSWTDWDQWGECSQSCGTGLMKRSRQCSNPYPGPYGNPCFGDYTDTKLCVLQDCTQIDGGWSGWTAWTGCSATCNGGLMTRDRHCDNPKPSSLGTYCDGRNMDSKLCNTNNCPDPIVFFTVEWPLESMVNDVVVFTDKVDTSSDNDYSTTTGKFTCRVPGLYHFSLTFISHLYMGSDGNTFCIIRKNNVFKAWAFNSAFGKSGYHKNRRSASSSVYLSLDSGDTVSVGGCKGWDNIRKSSTFHFVGALITAS